MIHAKPFLHSNFFVASQYFYINDHLPKKRKKYYTSELKINVLMSKHFDADTRLNKFTWNSYLFSCF